MLFNLLLFKSHEQLSSPPHVSLSNLDSDLKNELLSWNVQNITKTLLSSKTSITKPFDSIEDYVNYIQNILLEEIRATIEKRMRRSEEISLSFVSFGPSDESHNYLIKFKPNKNVFYEDILYLLTCRHKSVDVASGFAFFQPSEPHFLIFKVRSLIHTSLVEVTKDFIKNFCDSLPNIGDKNFGNSLSSIGDDLNSAMDLLQDNRDVGKWSVVSCGNLLSHRQIYEVVIKKPLFSSSPTLFGTVRPPPVHFDFDESSIVRASVPTVTVQGESVLIEDLVPFFKRVVEQKCTAQVEELVKKLNDSQRAAVAFCTDHLPYEFKDCYSSIPIVINPPWTGGDTVIAFVIRIHILCDIKVLVCSLSNTSIVRLVNSFVETLDDKCFPKFVLAGKPDDLVDLVTGTLVGAHIPSTDPINLLAFNFQQRLRLSLENILENWQSTNDRINCSINHTKVINILSVRLEVFYCGKHGPKGKHEALRQALALSDKIMVPQLISELISQFYSGKNPAVSKDIVQEYLSTAEVVFCTLSFSALSDTDSMFHIDVVIIDEAAQAFEPQILLPLNKFNPGHVILVGDPHQLPPHLESQPLRESRLGLCMERLIKFNEMPFIQLNVQQSMHPNISRIPNLMFYNGTIQDHPSLTDRECAISGLTDCEFITCRCAVIDVTGEQLFVNDMEGYQNNKEADMVLKILNFLRNMGVDCDKSVSVVTFYSAQVKCIRQLLTEKGFNADIVTEASLFSRHAQDYVIISYVCTRKTGFEENEHKLNVLWTRARHLLLSLCDCAFWTTVSFYTKQYIALSKDNNCKFSASNVIKMMESAVRA